MWHTHLNMKYEWLWTPLFMATFNWIIPFNWIQLNDNWMVFDSIEVNWSSIECSGIEHQLAPISFNRKKWHSIEVQLTPIGVNWQSLNSIVHQLASIECEHSIDANWITCHSMNWLTIDANCHSIDANSLNVQLSFNWTSIGNQFDWRQSIQLIGANDELNVNCSMAGANWRQLITNWLTIRWRQYIQ